MEKHRITVFCIKYNKTAGEGATVLKSFPQPLTAAEEKYYVQKYTEGDLEAKHILIERNLRLVAAVLFLFPHHILIHNVFSFQFCFYYDSV